MSTWRRDDGNAAIEFVYLSVLLMIPLMYVMLVVFDAQRASFGVTEAARQAGRVFVTECSRGEPAARARAVEAAGLALGDQGYTLNQPVTGLDCPRPGGSTTVGVSQFLQLPGVADLLPEERAGFAVSATFVAVRDEFAP